MNFIIFNVIFFTISYIIDYMAVNWFGLVEWSQNYLYYIILINLPLSTFITYKYVKKIKEFLGVE